MRLGVAAERGQQRGGVVAGGDAGVRRRVRVGDRHELGERRLVPGLLGREAAGELRRGRLAGSAGTGGTTWARSVGIASASIVRAWLSVCDRHDDEADGDHDDRDHADDAGEDRLLVDPRRSPGRGRPCTRLRFPSGDDVLCSSCSRTSAARGGRRAWPRPGRHCSKPLSTSTPAPSPESYPIRYAGTKPPAAVRPTSRP